MNWSNLYSLKDKNSAKGDRYSIGGEKKKEVMIKFGVHHNVMEWDRSKCHYLLWTIYKLYSLCMVICVLILELTVSPYLKSFENESRIKLWLMSWVMQNYLFIFA